jgi:arylsulfatase B
LDLWRDRQRLTEDQVDPTEHATTLFTNEALKVIQQQQHADQPFFLMVSYTAAHDPLLPAPEHVAHCTHFKSHRRRDFCGLIVGIDDAVRNITTSLKERSMWDNTIFVFSTDNGGNPVCLCASGL